MKKRLLRICLTAVCICSSAISFCQPSLNEVLVPVSELRKANIVFVEYDFLKSENSLLKALNQSMKMVVDNMNLQLENERQRFVLATKTIEQERVITEEYKRMNEYIQQQSKKQRRQNLLYGIGGGLIIGLIGGVIIAN